MYIAYKKIKKHQAKRREDAAAAAAAQSIPGDAQSGSSTIAQPLENASKPVSIDDDKVFVTADTAVPAERVQHANVEASVPSEKQVVPSPAPVPVDGAKAPHLCKHQRGHDAQSTAAVDAKGKCLACKEEKHNRRVYRWKLILGLLLPFFLASVDLTIVATALGFIASDFNKYNQLNWIVTSYTLTSTAFIPMFGQLADVFGRHSMMQVSLVLMAIGSTLAAAAQTWGMLLFGRALQGVSAAGIQVLITVILADKVSLADNAKNNTIFSLVSGFSYSIGPIIGGYLTNANWRYCFVLSIPIAVITGVIIFFILRRELLPGTFGENEPRSLRGFLQSLRGLDVGGFFIFLFGVGLIILGTAWGGSSYPWTSAHVLAPLIIGAVLFGLFLPYEWLLDKGRPLNRKFPHQVAMIPFELFRRWDMFRLFFVQFAAGVALYSAFYFVGIYFTLVEGYSASKAGIQLLYYIPGIGVGSYAAMFFVNVWPRQTFPPLVLGTLIETTGIALLTWAVTQRNVALVNGMMALAGCGTGIRFMPVSLHAVGIWPDKIANSMSIMRFALPIGGTLGLTIMGSVFNNKFGHALAAAHIGGDHSFSPHNTNALNSLKHLPPHLEAVVQDAGRNAVKWAFISILPILGLSFIASIFLGNVWVKVKNTGSGVNGDGEVEDHEGESLALRGSYLLALVRGRVKQDQVSSRPQALRQLAVETGKDSV